MNDHYFEQAKRQGFKARSVFKLSEIDQKLKIIKPHSAVLDLGSAPGSWLQYVATKINDRGFALGVDITPISERFHKNITTITHDCFSLTDEVIGEAIRDLGVEFTGFDVVLSDMAPKTSGMRHADQTRSFDLSMRALQIAEKFLRPRGSVVIKIFDGPDANQLVSAVKKLCKTVRHMRPEGVRAGSKEFYVVGIDRRTEK